MSLEKKKTEIKEKESDRDSGNRSGKGDTQLGEVGRQRQNQWAGRSRGEKGKEKVWGKKRKYMQRGKSEGGGEERRRRQIGREKEAERKKKMQR